MAELNESTLISHSFIHSHSESMSRSIRRQFIKILQARQKAKEEECGRGRRGNLIPIPYLTLGTTITAAPTALATLATLASHSVWAPTSSP